MATTILMGKYPHGTGHLRIEQVNQKCVIVCRIEELLRG